MNADKDRGFVEADNASPDRQVATHADLRVSASIGVGGFISVRRVYAWFWGPEPGRLKRWNYTARSGVFFRRNRVGWLELDEDWTKKLPPR